VVAADSSSLGERPRGHEASHHATLIELVLDRVCVVWAGLFEKPLEVVCRQPRLSLVAVCDGQGAFPARAACLTIIAIGHGPLKALLAPLSAAFDALLGVMGGNVRRCLPVTSWGRIPASLGMAKYDLLVAGGALGGDAAWLLERVPEEVVASALPWALCAVLR
jgi:hypothetical protein